MSTVERPAPRREAVRALAARRWDRLVATARRAGGGDDAEDAVQDVLAHLTASPVELPADPERLAAYAAVAVRRRAVELARRRGPVVDADEGTAEDARPPEERIEDARRLAAYAAALAAVPADRREVVLLDAAGWSRGEIAAASGLGPRRVKRTLDEHRGPVLAAAVRALDGSDCGRLAATLSAYGQGHGRPRPGGPVAEHLRLCDGCRAALRRARATRRALAALLPAPALPAPAPVPPLVGGIPALAGALKLAWPAVLVTAAAVGVGTRVVPHHEARPVPVHARPAAARPAIVPVSPRQRRPEGVRTEGPVRPSRRASSPVVPRSAAPARAAAASAVRAARAAAADLGPTLLGPTADPVRRPVAATSTRAPAPTFLPPPRRASRPPGPPRPAGGADLCGAQGLCAP